MLYLFAVGAGLASALQAGCTGALARSLRNPYAVVLVSLFGSFVVTGIVTFFAGGLTLGRLEPSAVPWWGWAAGVGGAIVLLSQPIVAPALGAASYIGVIVTSGVVASMALDHFGWLGFAQHTAGIGRMAGAAIMVIGVTLIALF